MKTRRWLILAALAGGGGSGRATDIQGTGAVKQALTLSPADLAQMPPATVRTMSNGL